MHQAIDKKYRWIFFLSILFLLTTFNFSNSNFMNLFFQIKSVEYNKTLFLEESLKSQAMDLLIDKNLLFLKKKNIKDLFFQNQWVKSVVLKKKFPNELYINITEYYPIGYYKEKGKIYLIDNNYQNSVLLKDIDLRNLIEFENIKNTKELKIFIKKLNNHKSFLSKIKKIKYIYNDRWNVVLKSQKLIKFGQYNLLEQINYLKFILKDKEIKLIDLRNKGQAVVSYGK